MDEIQYLTFDSLKEGVGASQVLAYMREVAKVRPVHIVSFEKIEPNVVDLHNLIKDGIDWTPLPFNQYGILGGLSRVLRMAKVVDRTKIIHARSTLPALAGILRLSVSTSRSAASIVWRFEMQPNFHIDAHYRTSNSF